MKIPVFKNNPPGGGDSPGRAARPHRPAPPARRRGFSLLEVMVATAILMIVVLMIGSIFTQASSAWDAGYGRAEGGAALRGVAGALSRDLSTLVDMRSFFPNEDEPVKISGSSLEFVAIKSNDGHRNNSNAAREFAWIRYSFGTSVQREEAPLRRRRGSWEKGDSSPPAVLYRKGGGGSGGAGYSASFSLEPVEAKGAAFSGRPYKADEVGETTWGDGSGTVPVGVKLRMTIKPSAAFSSLRVYSTGRDGIKDSESRSKDDIVAL